MTHAQSPLAAIRSSGDVETMSKPELLNICRALEARALDEPPAEAIAVLQDMRFAGRRARHTWAGIAASGTSIFVYGRDLPAYLADGVPGVSLDDDDPLVDVWAFLVRWNDGKAAGFVGLDVGAPRGDSGVADDDRDFEVTSLIDPELVIGAIADIKKSAATESAGGVMESHT